MAQNGKQTGLYLQKELEARIDAIVSQNKDVFHSRNHFINCAIISKLKEVEKNVFCESEGELEEGYNGGVEQREAAQRKILIGDLVP